MYNDIALRHLSRSFFGHDHRLALLLVIGRRRESFTISDLVTAIGAKHPSSIQRPLSALQAAGLIHDAETLGSSRERRYVRAESHAWALAEELYQRMNGQETLFAD